MCFSEASEHDEHATKSSKLEDKSSGAPASSTSESAPVEKRTESKQIVPDSENPFVLFVGGLNKTAREKDLKPEFERYGKVEALLNTLPMHVAYRLILLRFLV